MTFLNFCSDVKPKTLQKEYNLFYFFILSLHYIYSPDAKESDGGANT